MSSPGLALTQMETVDFKRLEGLPLVLPRRPAHWRSILDEAAKSKGFQLQAAVEADSLTLQKELIADNPHLYSLLGPFSMSKELRSGRLQAARVVSPDLKRYVTLARSKRGQLTQATRIVASLITETIKQWRGQLTPPI